MPLEVLQSLRGQLSRAEKAQRRAKQEAQAAASDKKQRAVKPQREKDLLMTC